MDVNGIINNVDNINNGNSNDKIANDKSQEVYNKKEDVKKTNNDEDINKGIDSLNKLLEKQNAHAEYSIHKELGATMIKIIDDKTQEIVMEIPKEKALDAVAAMLKNSGIIDEKA